MSSLLVDAKSWSYLMGRDLRRSESQPLQPVRINRNGCIEITVRSLRSLGFAAGDHVQVQLWKGRCVLRKHTQGGVPFRAGRPVKLPVSAEIAGALSPPGAVTAVLIGQEEEAKILPVMVQEYAPDPLGPRFIDELRGSCVVRHAVPGLPRDGWTPEALCELEEMLCSEPFRVDPVSAIAQGNDWVGWMTRNRVLKQPAQQDEELRDDLAAEVFDEQKDDGSWGSVPATAYAILWLLTLGEQAGNERLQQAAKWLLDLPEPPPRPGMWMLAEEYLEEWLSRREASEQRAFEPGEVQWTGPVPADCSFYDRRIEKHEQDEFRTQQAQQVIPRCARYHGPACEPKITHVSALVAEALMRCGYADHPRLRRYVNTISHVGGVWGYWCGCGALGLYDADIAPCENPPDFNVRAVAEDGQCDLSPWRWVANVSKCGFLADQKNLPVRDTHLEPFSWYHIPGADGFFALVGTGWQNGDCWAKTNRTLSQHPSCPGSLTEHLAIYQASRYQTSLGEWEQGFPAGMLTFLSLYNHGAAKSLVIKTVPWLREHQADDGLWHHEELPQGDRVDGAKPPEPRLAAYHIVSALHRFGLMDRLRP